MKESFICDLCPRRCNATRSEIKKGGYCGCTSVPTVAAAHLHLWEEPCISGKNGSGTVFFASCNLKCIYCQNSEFSRKSDDDECTEGIKRYTPDELAEIFLSLQEMGAHNINLVTPTPHVYAIIEALDKCKDKLFIPVVYNTSGYETEDTIDMLKYCVDIFLTDYKYFSEDLAKSYSSAPNYSHFASRALEKMLTTHRNAQYDEDGMMKRGIIVRHLCLPSHTSDSIDVINELYRLTGGRDILLSLMSQYLPNGDEALPKALKRRITTLEYEKVCRHARELGFDGFFQMRSSAEKGYVPRVGDMPKR